MFRQRESRVSICFAIALAFVGVACPALGSVELWVTGTAGGRFTWPDGQWVDYLPIGSGGITLGPNGNVYVTETYPGGVHEIAPDGTYIGEFVAAGAGGMQRSNNLAFGPDDNLYVLDWWRDVIVRFDGQTGAYIDDFASGSALDVASALRFGPDGNLYVTSSNNNSIVRFDGQTGQFLDVFATGGELEEPKGLLFGPDGLLYVGNGSINHPYGGSVVRFDPATGQSLGEFVLEGSGNLQKAGGLAFGPDGDLYVVDTLVETVRRYDGLTGAYIDNFAWDHGMFVIEDLLFVPEPGSLVLLGASCVVLLRRRR